jgi:hypothetical protein
VIVTLLRRLNGEADDDEALVVTPSVSANSVALRTLLETHEWNVARVARELGVTRMTIYNRMKRLGIERERVRKSESRRRRTLAAVATLAPESTPQPATPAAAHDDVLPEDTAVVTTCD